MSELIKTNIVTLVEEDNFIISNHARIRMTENNISTDQLIYLLISDEIIEDHPDDFPCHSSLVLSFLTSVPYHIVVGICQDHVRIITLYIPSPDFWKNFEERKGDKNSTKKL